MAPRGRLELDTGRAAQLQRVGEQPHRFLVRGGGQAPFQALLTVRGFSPAASASSSWVSAASARSCRSIPANLTEAAQLHGSLLDASGTRNPRPA